MNRILYFLLALIVVSACNQMEPEQNGKILSGEEGTISRAQAKETLTRLRCEFFPQTRSTNAKIASCEAYGRSLKPTTRSNEEPVLYVFNYEDNQGFAIMAATPSLPEVLAISDKGNLDLANLPNNGIRDFVSLLGDYVEEPDTFAVGDGEIYTVKTPWETIVNIPPMCKVKWHQKHPYNQYTPLINGQHADVGCGGVSVAQAMSIYGKPTSFHGYSFDWAAMTADNPTEEAIKQIARFLEVIGREDVGQFLYLHEGTGAYMIDLDSIFTYCGYKATHPEILVPDGNGGTSHLWMPYKDIDVCGELVAYRPVVIYGINGKGIFGNLAHFWLLHGYMQRQRIVEQRINTSTGTNVLSRKTETEDYVLCNWGWGGLYDGYYINGVFNQSGEFIPENPADAPIGGGGTDYSTQLEVIIDIVPK